MGVKLSGILKGGKAFYLAYDQGLEHGPSEFNDKNVDPKFIIEIARKGKFNGLIFQKGIAEKYKKEIKNSGVPLILKLNGKTSLYKGEPYSTLLCTVDEALKLGASAVGYTIYLGSEHEAKMLETFETIEREAHTKGIPVIAWVYPRGRSIKKKKSGELMAYAARTGLEIGADMIKIQYNRKMRDLKWAIRAAGRTKVVIAGGIKEGEKQFLEDVAEIMKSGANGLAVGRNIWQSKNPLEVARKVRGIIFRK